MFFSGLWSLFCSVGFEVCFFVGLGEEMTPQSEVGCAENILNTVVFERFNFFLVLSELDAIQSTFGCLFGSFLGTLGSLFLICESPGSRSEIR